MTPVMTVRGRTLNVVTGTVLIIESIKFRVTVGTKLSVVELRVLVNVNV